MISTFLDIEASGLQAESYPIEIAWSDTLGNTDSFLIRPDPGWTHWDAMAESIHNIPREKLFQEGISVLDACERLNRSLGCEIVYSDAADFDNAWLQRLYDSADIKPSFMLQDIFSFYELLPSKQVGLIQHIVSANPAPHRALQDCQRYAKAYEYSQSAEEICRTVLATGTRSVLFVCTANIQRSKTCDADRVNRLVLYGTGPMGELPGRFEPLEKSMAKVQRDGTEEAKYYTVESWFKKGSKDSSFESGMELAQGVSLQTYINGLNAMADWSAVGRLDQIQSQTLVVWGDIDRSYIWQQPYALWQEIKDASLAVIPGCSHNAHLENPQLFNQLLFDFLTQD